ncbi:MAG: hypothetical protein NTW29_18035 [Bacteroidetes bacterium]|nr:hypothetical protein [Bacteroidota bacterium]
MNIRFIILIIGFVGFSSCNSSRSKREAKISSSSNKVSVFTNFKDTALKTFSSYVWNVPTLICINIDILIDLIKDSVNVDIDSISLNKQKGLPTKEFVFAKGREHSLYITVNQSNRKILYLFIDAIESEYFSADGATADYKDLLRIGNLQMSAENYYIEPIQSLHIENRFTGIKIIPKCL